MAITAYTGPPGSGKSHALVKDVILRAVMAGRRVVSNVAGLDPNAIEAYCMDRLDQCTVPLERLGKVVLFHGEDSREPGFWPTEETTNAGLPSFVQPGDLVVFDEWAMFWPPGDQRPGGKRGEPKPFFAAGEVEAFMRWHRHMTTAEGVATDLAIATQSISDFHRRHRPLISRSFDFKKLDAVGRAQSYTWKAYDGRYQKNAYRVGHGNYDPNVFPLYKSSEAPGEGSHTELQTNEKASIWNGWQMKATVAAGPILLLAGAWGLWFAFPDEAEATAAPAAEQAAPGAPGPAAAPAAPAPSPWRIVGHIEGDFGTRVMIAREDGVMRMVEPAGFDFDDGRPLRGLVDGRMAYAEERLPVGGASGSLLDAMR